MHLVAPERPRVLIAAGAEQQPSFETLFAQEPLDQWETAAATSFAQARFALQYQPCDLLLINNDLVEREGSQGLAWLAFQLETPVLFLGDDRPEMYLRVFDLGLNTCLPYSMAMMQPALLHLAMRHAIAAWEVKLHHKRLQGQLEKTQRQVERLTQMIWRVTPISDDQWYSQRHMLERLGEELTRCHRHHLPLSVAMGELRSPDRSQIMNLPDDAAAALLRGKRRCDVIGHYGSGGFMLLMVHTSKRGGVACCRRLRQYLEAPAQELDGPRRSMHSFFGVASSTIATTTPQSLLRIAEENLQAARTCAESQIVAN